MKNKDNKPSFLRKCDQYNEGNNPGFAALVVKHGKAILKKGYGTRNLESGELIDVESNFRIASLTKQFTATAIAILEERKKINCNDKIVEYFPDFPSYGHKISISHLIYHLSGLPDYYYSLCTSDKGAKPLSNQDIFYFLNENSELEFPPGNKFQYSNTGYAILGSLIERVSGLSYPDFINTHIFQPTNMSKSIVITYPEPEISKRALGYSEWPFFDLDDYNSGNYLHGEDGIYTSINDMLKWIHSIENNVIVSSKTQKKIFSKSKTNHGDTVDYGYGWEFDRLFNQETIFHTGGWLGFNSIIVHFPIQKLWIVILANCSTISSWNLMETMAEYYLKFK